MKRFNLHCVSRMIREELTHVRSLQACARHSVPLRRVCVFRQHRRNEPDLRFHLASVSPWLCTGREEPGADRLPVDPADVERRLPPLEQGGLRWTGGDPHPQQPGVEARPGSLQQVRLYPSVPKSKHIAKKLSTFNKICNIKDYWSPSPDFWKIC